MMVHHSARLLACIMLAGCISSSAPPDDARPAPDDAVLEWLCDPCNVPVSTGPDKSFEPYVAVNPHDPGHVVIVETPIPGEPGGATLREYAVYVSRDSGASWTATWSSRDHVAAGPWAGCAVIGDAVAAFAADGSLVVGGMAGLHIGALSVFAMRSTDGGQSFADPVWLDTGAPAPACGAEPLPPTGRHTRSVDKPDLAAGPDGSVAMSWNRMGFDNGAGDGGFHLAWSDDNGTTWSAPQRVPEGDGLGGDMVLSDRTTLGIALFSDGSSFIETRDRGATWTASRIGDVNNQYPSYARLANGTHVVGWPQWDGAAHVPSLAFSQDGLNWSWVALAPPSDQFPMIAIDADDGTVFASYWTGSDEIRREVRTWQVGHLGEPVVLGPPESQPHDMTPVGYGHYQGLASFPGGAYAAWGVGPPAAADLYAARVIAPHAGVP